jgi:predicted amidohydrolase
MKQTSRLLCTLQFESNQDYEKNLATLSRLIKQTPANAVVLAPEVCLSGFDYERLEAAALFSTKALKELLSLSEERIIAFTLIEKNESGEFFNVAKVLHKKCLVHEQAKNRLFKLGDEHKHFSQSQDKKLCLFEIEGIKFGLLICFELRFKQYWQDLEGADIILVPARWGKSRAEHFTILTEALAIMNQCYVMGADGANEECASMSGIISPFGKASRNGNTLCLSIPYDTQEIRRMRRYLNVGI